MVFEESGIVLDLTHEKITDETLNLLEEVATKSNVYSSIAKMFSGVSADLQLLLRNFKRKIEEVVLIFNWNHKLLSLDYSFF